MVNHEEPSKPNDAAADMSAESADFKKFYAEKILKSKQDLCFQVEFYFSDSNLYVDDFLNKVMSQNDGWVPIKTLLTFTRVKRLVEKAQKDIPIVDPAQLLSEALHESKALLRVSEDNLKVQRATPMEDPSVVAERTVAVFGFPSDREFNEVEQKKFWEQYGDVRCIRRLKARSKSMLVIEYASNETAQKVINLEKIIFEGIELRIRKRMVAKKFQKSRKRKRYDDDYGDDLDECIPYTSDRVLKLVDLPENVKWKDLRVWVENSFIGKRDGFYLKVVWDDEYAYIRLKGDVSAEDAVEKLENTRWVRDGEEKPNVEIVEDCNAIWNELGTSSVKKSQGSRRKKRRCKEPGSKQPKWKQW